MERKLRNMKKIELIELLLEQEKEIERLKAENDVLKDQTNIQQIKLNSAGSIAEASLLLSGVFEAAQRAADLYLNSVKTMGGVNGEDIYKAEPSDNTGN